MSAVRPEVGRPPRPADGYVVVLLAVVTLLAFWHVREHRFLSYDDPGYVTENPRVLEGLSVDGLAWACTTGAQGNWHPLTWISHMVDAELFGLDARGHHLTNLLLHLANTGLLFLFLRRATGSSHRSGLVAALFAVHPLHVESVAWVAERKDVLSTAFLMLTLIAYLRHARRPGPARYLSVVVLFALGLAAKPMLVTLPFLLLLLDYWPLGRLRSTLGPDFAAGLPAHAVPPARPARLVLEKLPLLVLALGSSVVTFLVQRSGLAVKPLETFPLGSRLANAAISYVGYIRKMFWPDDLAFFYPYPRQFSTLQVVASAIALLAVTALAVRYARRAPWFTVGWLWFAGLLVPVIGLVQVGAQAMADRYTYVPLVGLFVIVAWGAGVIADGRRGRRLALSLLSVIVIVALVFLTRAQTRHWRESISLYEHALAVTEDNYVAHDLLGLALHREGRTDAAVEQYTAALRIAPDYAVAYNNLGVIFAERGRYEEAIERYRSALRVEPRYASARNNLGIALASLRRVDEALEQFEEALRLDPDDPEVHHNLGIALSMQGDTARALEHYLEALRLEPDWHSVAIAAAWILATHPDPEVRDSAEAVRLAERACRANGFRNPRQLDTLAAAYAAAGRLEEAVSTAERAAALAEERNEPGLAAGIRAKLERYRRGLGGEPPKDRPGPLSPGN